MGGARAVAVRMSLALGAGLLTILLVEGVLRLSAPTGLPGARQQFGLSFLRWDPFRGAYLVPGYERPELSINRAGRRGLALDPARDRRIVCLGDSSTFGLWVEGETQERVIHLDSYPAVFAELLHGGGYDEWQVVNAGVPGSHAAQSLRILRREVLPLNPEIVTLRVGVNDHARQALPWQDDPTTPWLRRLFYAFGDWKLMHLGLRAHFELSPSLPRRRLVPPEAFRRALEAIVDESRRNDFRLIFIDYPLRPPRDRDPVAKRIATLYGDEDVASFYRIHEEYQDIMRSVAGRSGTPVVLSAPALLEPDVPGFAADNVHPDADGMRLTAQLTYRAVLRLGWLGKRERDVPGTGSAGPAPPHESRGW